MQGKSVGRNRQVSAFQCTPAPPTPLRRHERAPVADRQRGLVGVVTERQRRLCGPQEQIVPDAVAQFVGREGGGKSVAVSRHGPRSMATISRPACGEFMGQDRARPAEPNDHDIVRRQACAPSWLSICFAPFRAAADADRGQRISFVVTPDPVAIVVASTRESRSSSSRPCRGCRHRSGRRKNLPEHSATS